MKLSNGTRLGSLIVFIFICLFLTAVAVRAQGIILTLSQIDKSKFPEVTVYVSVTDSHGNPVTGLTKQNLQVREGDKEVVFNFKGGDGQLAEVTTVLVIDRSGSMASEGKLEAAKGAAQTFVQLMSASDRTALVAFNHEVGVVQELTSDKSLLARGINSLVSGGNTAVYDGAVKGAEILQAAAGRKAAILLTDGLDNSSKNSRANAIEKAKEAGFSLFTIGLGKTEIDRGALEQLAVETGGKMFLAPSASDLTGLYQLIHEQLTKEYRLVYHSPRPVEDGTRRPVTVTLNFQNVLLEDQKYYVVAGVLPPSGLTTWTASSWILFWCLLVLMSLLLVPQGIPALITKRGKAFALPVAGVPPKPTAPPVPKIGFSLSAVFPLTKADISLGSGTGNDIVIRDASVAERHARIFQQAGRDVVEDSGSATGTFVSYGGEPGQERKVLTRNALKEGSYIRLGSTKPLTYHAQPRSLVVEYTFPGDKFITIGSDPANDIVLPAPSASGKHAQLGWQEGTFAVEDLASEQGTFVRYGGDSAPERRVTGKNALKHGSIIRIGNILFRLLTDSKPDASSTESERKQNIMAHNLATPVLRWYNKFLSKFRHNR